VFLSGAAVWLWLTALRLFSEYVAVGAAALFVLNGFFAAYAQEARPYAFTLFLSAAAMYLFVRAVQDKDRRWWIGWGLVGAFSIYGHPFAVGPLIAAHLSLLVLKERPKLANWATAAVIQLGLCIPLVVIFATQDQEHIAWIPPITVSAIGGSANLVTGHGGPGMTFLVALLVLVAGVHAVKTREWNLTLVVLWALVLPAILVFVSPFKSVMVPRYLAPAIPGVMLAGVVAITKFEFQFYRIGAAGLFAVFAVVSVNTYFTHGAKDDWREATAYVLHNAQPGDAIIISYDQRDVFQYYFMRDGGKTGSAPVPLSPARPWGSAIVEHEKRIDTLSAGQIAQAVAPYQRVWSLYLDDQPYSPQLKLGLQTVFDTGEIKSFPPRVQAALFSHS
jgi:mannosyltransferase